MKGQKDEEVKLLPREAEFTLGLVGGIMGLLCSLLYIYFTFSITDAWFFRILLPAISALVAAVIAIWASFKVQYESRKAGVLFVVCGVWQLVILNITIVSGVILVITGYMCLYRK